MKNESKLEQDKKILTTMIYEKYNTFNLNKAQYGEVINRSPASVNRDIAQSKSAAYKKDANGRVYFPLHSTVDYLLNTIHTMESLEFNHE